MSMLENMCATAGIGLPGGPELIVIFVIILLIFGPKQLPALSRSIGKAITDFKKGLNDIKDDIETAADAEPEVAKKTAEAPKPVNEPAVKS
ncbi:MAG TPA: twin-arginine translocase TatA/TatE family subunit [Candidatus Sumerlaeota bacterium]|nr:twin-arginine translocase TatA/TatE family subunit [Candidatus Sumerlaeota bacterium]